MLNNIRRSEKGIAILEVLLSLVITAIIVSLVLRLYIDQYRLTSEVIQKAELRFAVFKAGQVLSSAITKAQKVEWINGDTLRVEYAQGEQLIADSFYLDDKNFNEELVLYRKHFGVSNPIVNGLTEMDCIQVGKGLWEIHLKASRGSQESEWSKKVRQRICSQ